jgi:hypothetical protein
VAERALNTKTEDSLRSATRVAGGVMSVGNPSRKFPRQATVTDDSSLDFSGGVVLYATELSGSLLGIPVTMTNVTTDDFLVASDSLQANDLDITSGA